MAEAKMEEIIIEYLKREGEFSDGEKNTYIDIKEYLDDDNYDDSNSNHVKFYYTYVHDDDMEYEIAEYIERIIIRKEERDCSIEAFIDEYLDFSYCKHNPNHDIYISIT
jgi:hypothetical protein